jgi:cell division protein FtsL
MNLRALFERRVKGVRMMELIACGCLVSLVLGVYIAKNAGGREGAEIAKINQDIRAEERRLKLLRAELAHLERPERIEHLATTYLGMTPVPAKRETLPEGLPEVARHSEAQR